MEPSIFQTSLFKESPLVLYNLSDDKPYYEAMLNQANQEGKNLFQMAHERGFDECFRDGVHTGFLFLSFKPGEGPRYAHEIQVFADALPKLDRKIAVYQASPSIK